MRSLGPLALLGIVVLVIIVAAGAYAWITLSKYIHLGGQQTHRILGANQTASVSAVMANMTQGFNTSQFSVQYAGNASVGIYGVQLMIPVEVGLARYYNDSRAVVAATGVPVLGNVSVVQIRNGSSYYSCTKGTNASRAGYQCTQEQKSGSVLNLVYAAINGSASGQFNSTQMHFGTVNQSSYNGMPCTNMDGYFNYTNSTGLANINSGSFSGKDVQSGSLSFFACISNQDRIPLTMQLYVTANAGNSVTSGSLQLNEVSFARTSSPDITALPGPVTNQTG